VNLYGFVQNFPSTVVDRLGLQASPFSNQLPTPQPPGIRNQMMRQLMREIDGTPNPSGGRNRPNLPRQFPGRLDSSYTVNLSQKSQVGRRCCCLYSGSLRMPNLQQNQIEISGFWTPSQQPPIILYVDEPEAGCETLPDTISIRIMIVSTNGFAYDVIEANGGNTARQEDGFFNLCDKRPDALTGIVIKSDSNHNELPEWTPDVGNDFGEPWER
jgi:hypothetical protein